MFLSTMNPMDQYKVNGSHNQGYSGAGEYNAVDIGGVIDHAALTALVQQAAARLPANQQLKVGENWGYYIQVHVTEGHGQAVIVRPYPYKTWGWGRG